MRNQRTTDDERRYMRAMAELDGDLYAVKDVALKLGRKPLDVARTNRALVGKGLIYSPADEVIAFSIPMFAAYMKRLMPFRPPKSVSKTRRTRRRTG